MLVPDFIGDVTCIYTQSSFVLVENFAFYDSVLYVANKHKIYLIACKDNLSKGEERKLPYQK
jgi:hypothetical protein